MHTCSLTPLTFFILLSALAGTVHAHHSMHATYNMDKVMEISGDVVEFKFRSPHSWVILDVEDDAGNQQRWKIESSAVPTLRRVGFTRNTFKPGDRVSATGWPSKNSSPRLFGFSFVTAEGKTMVAMKKRGKASTVDRELAGIMRIQGRWSSIVTPVDVELEHELPREPLPLSPAGIEARDNYDPALSPGNTCTPTNLPALFFGPGYLLDIQVTSKETVLQHEFYGVTRTVVMDAAPKQSEPSGFFGFASGRIENDELVVESSQFPPSRWGITIASLPNSEGADIPSSAKKKIIERYSVSDDGKTLIVKYTLEDPVYLTRPYSGQARFLRVADDKPMYPFECEAYADAD